MVMQLNSGKKRLGFSAHTANIVLSLLLRNKKSYDDLRYSGLLRLPHPSTLKKITKDMNVLPGGDPSI